MKSRKGRGKRETDRWTLATTEIEVHLLANLKAFKTSPVVSGPGLRARGTVEGRKEDTIPGEIFTITEVLAPPPRAPYNNNLILRGRELLTWRRRVSLESRYGTYFARSRSSVTVVCCLLNAEMQLPKAERDKLMLLLSSALM
jgi:hypothetical protein